MDGASAALGGGTTSDDLSTLRIVLSPSLVSIWTVSTIGSDVLFEDDKLTAGGKDAAALAEIGFLGGGRFRNVAGRNAMGAIFFFLAAGGINKGRAVLAFGLAAGMAVAAPDDESSALLSLLASFLAAGKSPNNPPTMVVVDLT